MVQVAVLMAQPSQTTQGAATTCSLLLGVVAGLQVSTA